MKKKEMIKNFNNLLLELGIQNVEVTSQPIVTIEDNISGSRLGFAHAMERRVDSIYDSKDDKFTLLDCLKECESKKEKILILSLNNCVLRYITIPIQYIPQ